jgi:hypothetical protein
MKQVITANLELNKISGQNKLLHGCNKSEAMQLGAKCINNNDHEEILDEIARCK